MNIQEAGRNLRSWQVSCAELVDHAIEQAEAHSGLNAFITITADAARRKAQALDKELREGTDRGPLHGIPIALKDLFYTRGVRTTGGSKIFSDFVPDYDATVVRRLEEAGAVSIGKLNMHEFAYGITSTNPHYGAVRNPHDLDHIPGGSSGGSGATVAAGIVFCGMGSDTGGSIRIPAAYCGTVGFKPTFGRVSRYGCMPLGLTLDHMGPLTRTVHDAGLVLNAIAGHDPHDEGTLPRAVDAIRSNTSLKGVRFGRPENFFNERVHPEVRGAWDKALRAAEWAGAEVVELRVPDPDAVNVIARTILLCEASAVMMPHANRREEFGEDVLSLFDQGRTLAATDYINAQRVRRRMISEWLRLFDRVDVLCTPTTPIPAPAIGEKTVRIEGSEEDARLASTRFVRGINVMGFPAISIPSGAAASGLPVGLQLIAKSWQDARLIEIAAALEAVIK